jgi:hypothetical protein
LIDPFVAILEHGDRQAAAKQSDAAPPAAAVPPSGDVEIDPKLE